MERKEGGRDQMGKEEKERTGTDSEGDRVVMAVSGGVMISCHGWGRSEDSARDGKEKGRRRRSTNL